jgi:hypothetical protein
VVVGGAALARNGDGGPERQPTGGQSGSNDPRGDTSSDLDAAVDVPTLDAGTDPPASGDGSTAGGSSSTAGSGPSGTTKGTLPSGSVQRTETSSHTHTTTGAVTQVGSEDKTSVGHTTDTTIKNVYVPPPTTAPATTTPTEPTTSTSAG